METLYRMAGPGGIETSSQEEVNHLSLCPECLEPVRLVRPLEKPVEFKQQTNLDLRSSRGALFGGIVVVIITVIFYIIFSPLVLAR